MLGFYVHVPFCHGKCPYCDFYSLPDSQENMDAYVQAVLTSLAPWREKPLKRYCILRFTAPFAFF